MKDKIIKNKCEVDDCEEVENLHLHHIIERTELNTTNHNLNLCILCPNHHNHTHSGRLKIIGIFPSTKLPNKRTLVYEWDGKRNIDGIDLPYIEFKSKSFKIAE
jgi:uncharacterized membrane protein